MSKLFVIGNGFDLSHNLKTSYEDFRKYLLRNYNCDIHEDYTIPGYNGRPENEDEIVSFIIEIVSNGGIHLWKDFERTIGDLTFDEYFNDNIPITSQLYIAGTIADYIKRTALYFSKWINSIELPDSIAKIGFQQIIDADNDFFLTFNYTKTLEVLYNVKNVCHIHGEQGKELIFGHGVEGSPNLGYALRDETDCGLYLANQALKKDTKSAIERNINFFDKLHSIDGIYSYGFSFSDVDAVYIKKICSMDTADITWHLHSYDDDKTKEKYRNVIYSCGFQGRTDVF